MGLLDGTADICDSWPASGKLSDSASQVVVAPATCAAGKKRKITMSAVPPAGSKIEVTLAEVWVESHDPTGFFLSEKLDGMRAVWDGSVMYSRNGKEVDVPHDLLDQLPNGIALDGELWGGRGNFQPTMSIVKRGTAPDNRPNWNRIQYKVFDAPKVNGPFQTRLNAAAEALRNSGCMWASMLEQVRCKGGGHVTEEFKRITKAGGEGIMLRDAQAPYQGGRSPQLRKLKPWIDEEATVTGIHLGTGKNAGRMGSLSCKNKEGKTFRVGSGFTEAQRDNPPRIGTEITYKYQELTNDGKPRFPIFLRVRADSGM